MEDNQKLILGHKPGLYVLFATEMWERFSFYGMKALLIYYLTKYHLFSDEAGNLTVGSYAALVYAFPVIGGYLADKYLGFRKAVIYGAILLVLGHLGMAFEGTPATLNADGTVVRDQGALQIFYFSMALIIVGVGFLKANISSIVGNLYDEGDEKRDSGFTIFYMGINLGSFMATLLCGWLGETYGWNYGFGAAGIGMLLGLITFIWGQKFLIGKAEPPSEEVLQTKRFGISTEIWIYILGLVGVVLAYGFVQKHTVVEILLIVSGIISLGRIGYFIFLSKDKVERDRLKVLTVLILFSIIFWALFEQAYTSLNLFADRAIDRKLDSGSEIPASWFLSLNALFIILFAPVFAWLWVKLEKLSANPGSYLKFALGIILAAAGFGVLVLGCMEAVAGKVNMWYLVIAYFLHTAGEICVSPVGLSSVTKLSPVKMVGFMMGVWFLATASSEYIAALLANIAKVDTHAGEVADAAQAIPSYQNLFYILFVMGGVFGVLLLLLSPILKKWSHGIK